MCVCVPKRWEGLRNFRFTPPKTNMEPKNGEVDDDFPFQRYDFLRFHVNFLGSTFSCRNHGSVENGMSPI